MSSAIATSACGLVRTIRCRPLLTMPRSSHALRSRLTVNSVAGANQPKDYLLTVWRQLGQLDAAGHQHEEYVGLVPFVEEELAGVGLFRIRHADNLRERVQREPLEQRDMQESTGDLGHILTGHVGSSSCHTSSRARL